MKLEVGERLVLLNVLPKEGNFLTLKLVRKLREELSFDEAELKTLELQQVGENVTWKRDADLVKDCNIGEKMTDLVVGELEKLDKEGKLRDEHFTLYEKFVEN